MIREAAINKFCEVMIDALINCIVLVTGINDPCENEKDDKDDDD
jgi:hypothetical protein